MFEPAEEKARCCSAQSCFRAKNFKAKNSKTKTWVVLGGLLCGVSCWLGALNTKARAVQGAQAAKGVPKGWQTKAPREEIKPHFRYKADGGRSGRGAWLIETDGREGLDGYWQKVFPVKGGQYYHFEIYRRTHNVPVPRRSVVVKITWQDDHGRLVPLERPAVDFYSPGAVIKARPRFPLDGPTDSNGWTKVCGDYWVPSKATQAVVELHLRWVANGQVEWSDLELKPIPKPKPRLVRLAAVHFRPEKGHTPKEKREQFAPLIAKAAEQKADLVVLPEVLTSYGTGLPPEKVAEPIPGPSTEFFGRLAKKFNLYIVAGLLERDRHLIYNVAVLIGPDGNLVGKYRKVCLPREEIVQGVAPGYDYPVFQTRFGKVGMMICYDGFFPEPARELAKRGAEIIAWPVWGCNPLLARARACENHVYLVSSTYTDYSRHWIVSGVFDHRGELLAVAKKWGDVAVAEVDLNARTEWSYIGDFKSASVRHRPISPEELPCCGCAKPTRAMIGQ